MTGPLLLLLAGLVGLSLVMGPLFALLMLGVAVTVALFYEG